MQSPHNTGLKICISILICMHLISVYLCLDGAMLLWVLVKLMERVPFMLYLAYCIIAGHVQLHTFIYAML